MIFSPDTAFEPNDPTVISETIDGETVIINLVSGSYYSLRNAGATIWAAIQQSAPLAEISQMICSRFDVDGAEVNREICSLLEELLQEDLIRPATRGGTRFDHDNVSAAAFAPFASPVLEKFTDLEAMLLLDPVHDVDDEGWPNLPMRGQLDA